MLKLTYIKEFDFEKTKKWIKKYKFVVGLLLATTVAAYSNTLDVSEPPPEPIVVIERVEVPGPTEYIHVPGPTEYVNVPVPGPTEYVEVPGPIEYRECDSIWNHFHSPKESDILWWEEGNGNGSDNGQDDNGDDNNGDDDNGDDDNGDDDNGDDGCSGHGSSNGGHGSHGQGHGHGHR